MLYISKEITKELTENKIETANIQEKYTKFSNLITSVLKLLKKEDIKSIAKKYENKDNQFGDILLCAYYAAKSNNKKAYDYGEKAIKEGSFDNLLVLLNAKWINPPFRSKFLNEFDEKVRGMLSKQDSSVIRVPTPESLSFMSNAYYFGNTVFFVDHVKAVHWFLLALDYKSERALNSLINILVSERELTLLLENNGIKQFFELLIAKNLRSRHVAELHLARILIEQDKEQICPDAYILVNYSLNNEKIGHKSRRGYFWSNIPDRIEQYTFSQKEHELLQAIENESNNLYVRGRAAYDLACLHMWGGYKKQETLEKTLKYFSLAFKMGIFQSAFFLIVIQGHLQNSTLPKQLNSNKLWYTNSLKITTRRFSRQDSLISKRNKHHNVAFNKFEKQNVTLRKHFPRSNPGKHLNPYIFDMFGAGSDQFPGRGIKTLRQNASHDFLANFFLENKYPAFQALPEKKLNALLKHRLYTKGRPKISIIGGGLTGIITALQIANLKDKHREPLFDIHIFEKQAHLLNGASKVVSRLHLGGEYPKDGLTAQQCLLSAILFRQMFQTELFLTSRKAIDFLVARASLHTPRSNHQLEFTTLMQQYEALRDIYQRYYDELKTLWGEDTANRLFGKPEEFFRILEKKELEALGVDLHFAGGLHTPERGFQPVGLGIMLEHLLKQRKNITIHCSSGIQHIRPIKKGYQMEIVSPTDLPSTFYTSYIINASWSGVPHINSQVKKSSPENPQKDVETTVYLRSIALVDISECRIPPDRSFFGLIGEHGGMLSFFNDNVASIFVPIDGLSYQGRYDLKEGSPLTNSLPRKAWEHYYKLSNTAMGDEVAREILCNAKEKYAFLEKAKVISLITQTTLSRDEELHQRQYDNVRWVDTYNRCLEAYSPKGSFAIFTALQVLIKLLEVPKISRLAQPLDKETQLFLSQFKDNINPGDKDQSSLNTVKLPSSLCLVKNDRDLPPVADWVPLAHLYAFNRRLPLRLFDCNSTQIKARMEIAEKFKVIRWLNVIDLKDNILSPSLGGALLKVLKQGNIQHLKLGRVEVCKNKNESSYKGRKINGTFLYNKAEIDLSIKILTQAASLDSLESLYLYNWDLRDERFCEPLLKLWTRLKSFSLIGGLISATVAKKVIVKGSKLQALTLANLTDSSIPLALISDRLYILSNLEELNLANVRMESNCLETMIRKQSSLKRLCLRGPYPYLQYTNKAEQSHIDEQLMRYENVASAISNAKNLESIDLRGNIGLELIQDALEYYFLKKREYAQLKEK
ncbi:FAD-dependent oxidoreductase [Candidatus Odyssella thessalonicensis]|uniref:FAD-dependent oxidoreductase n=1 Tax=Candidatus Odyssella thessalonicensis TaxID=84647 RepID=UPI000225B1EF|nr:FAD-dependent oxidoreductase [Candidatus Odyssella thessalonicensis]